MSTDRAALYVVATPIGNLGDLSPRACETLRSADLIAAEDTRHTGRLLARLGIDTPMVSFHEHNEHERTDELIGRLLAGDSVALVSDAGTPLVSDPGYRLLAAARERGIETSPVPGPCAAIAALSVAGLPVHAFVFEGFLPARAGARRSRIGALAEDSRTLIFYESPERIAGTLADLTEILGGARRATLARELTKLYETIWHGTLEELGARVQSDANSRRGELALVVEGAPEGAADASDAELEALLRALLEELPVSQAVRVAVRVSGRRRNEVYGVAVALKAAG